MIWQRLPNCTFSVVNFKFISVLFFSSASQRQASALSNCHFTERKKREKEEREMNGEGKVVCVTGASGYIASWLVKLLLARGYTVKATVRSLSQYSLSSSHLYKFCIYVVFNLLINLLKH